MNRISIFTLKCLRYAYQGIFGLPYFNQIPLCSNEEGGELVFKMITDNEPCMIARYGATELNCLLNYLAIQRQDKNIWRYIRGETGDWWWNEQVIKVMARWSGFFPSNKDNLERFSKLLIDDSNEVNLLAVIHSTIKKMGKVSNFIPSETRFIPIVSLDSFLYQHPWTRALEGKQVLVVHPFTDLIERQYEKRKLLFEDHNVLPDFNLKTLKAVQSLGGNNDSFPDWFEALRWMEDEMDKIDYEIALIGCGAYGFSLAAHAKRTNHKAVHVGGALQLLFGIKGNRWEDDFYGVNFGIPIGKYKQFLSNPSWVRPEQYISEAIKNVDERNPYL